MACPPERYANLPIAPQYKQGLIQFCSDPNNEAACTQLCESTDEEIVQSIGQIEAQLNDWKENGVPDEVRNASPELANELGSPNEDTDGGIAALAPEIDAAAATPPVNPQIPPGQLADVPMPMDVSPSPSSDAPGLSYRNGGFVNAPSYGLGGFVEDTFDTVKGAVGGNSGVLGAIIGGAAAYYTGGMSVLAGASLGSAAGTYAGTGDLGAAAGAGLSTFGLGAAGMGIWGGTTKGVVGGAAVGGSLLAGSQPPPQPPMQPMPAQQGNPHSGDVTIPGTGSRIEANPQLAQGLGQLPTMSTGLSSGDAFGATDMNNIAPVGTQTAQLALDPMDTYYQCVIANGAENCQMPEYSNTPVPIQRAQYAPSYNQRMQTDADRRADAWEESQRGLADSWDKRADEWDKRADEWDEVQDYQVSPQSYQGGGEVNGIGTETSDSQPAWLSDNEFVMTADAVRGLGDGNIDIGASKMYDLMAELEQRGY